MQSPRLCEDVKQNLMSSWTADPSLDEALNKLGMLATSSNSRREYLKEITRKQYNVNMLHINTRYVSNVSIGFQLRPLTPHVRYKPYAIKERHRTRSENNDSNDQDVGLAKAIIDDVVDASTELAQLKKAKSLESIVAESGAPKLDLQNFAIAFPSEMEVVSDSIQNLRVAE